MNNTLTIQNKKMNFDSLNFKKELKSNSLTEMLLEKIEKTKEKENFKIGQRGFVVEKVSFGILDKERKIIHFSNGMKIEFNKKKDFYMISYNNNSVKMDFIERKIKIKTHNISYKKKFKDFDEMENSLRFILNKISQTGKLVFSINID